MNDRLHYRIGTFRQFEILLSVYELGSISRAAQKLYLTQPSVTMQLKKVSEAVGMPLYDYVGKKLVFTQAGQAVVDSARDILRRLDVLDTELADLRGVKVGALNIAVVTTAKYFVPHFLGPFCEHYPQVNVSFVVGNRQQIISRFKEGRDDFYIFSQPPETGDIETIEFLENPLVAIAHESHPLRNTKNISLQRFAKEPLLLREEGSGTRLAVEEFMRKKGVELNVRMTIESNEAIKHCVMARLGVSILSQHTLDVGSSSQLCQLHVKGFPIQTCWHIAYKKNKYLSPVAKTFLNYIVTSADTLLKDQEKLK